MKIENYKGIEGCVKVVGAKPGPKVVIMAGVHGDEPLGIDLIEFLHCSINTQKLSGEILTILGNPEACKMGERATAEDRDLNRIFSHDHVKRIMKVDPEHRTPEEKRLLELVPLLEGTDFLLDIHQTRKPVDGGGWFACSADTEMHHMIVSQSGIETVVSPATPSAVQTMSDCTDTYIDSIGGIGITLEAGCKDDNIALNQYRLYSCVTQFLGATGATPLPAEHEPKVQEQLAVMLLEGEIIANTDNFQFQPGIKNLSAAHYEDRVIAHDGGQPIILEAGSRLVFPKFNVKAGKPAGYIATNHMRPTVPSSERGQLSLPLNLVKSLRHNSRAIS